MEQIGQIVDNLRKNTNLMPQNTQLPTLGAKKTLSRNIFDKGIAYLEAAKQENFSSETLTVWFTEMTRRGWTDEYFRERVLAVISNTTYGKVEFNHFVDASKMWTSEQMESEVNRRINNRKAMYLRLKNGLGWSDDEMAKQGLIDLQIIADREYQSLLEREIAKIKVRVKKARAFFLTAPEEIKLEIKVIAESKGYKDEFWRQSIPVVMVHILTEVENIMRRVK